jgi:hypothetical protein
VVSAVLDVGFRFGSRVPMGMVWCGCVCVRERESWKTVGGGGSGGWEGGGWCLMVAGMVDGGGLLSGKDWGRQRQESGGYRDFFSIFCISLNIKYFLIFS